MWSNIKLIVGGTILAVAAILGLICLVNRVSTDSVDYEKMVNEKHPGAKIEHFDMRSIHYCIVQDTNKNVFYVRFENLSNSIDMDRQLFQ